MQRDRNLPLLGRLAKHTEYDWRDNGSARQDRSSLDGRVSKFLFLDTWMIDGESDVDDDCHLRPDACRANASAAAPVADFFLSCSDCNNARRTGLLRVSP